MGGVLNTATPQKNLTNTASPQEKKTQHATATIIFSYMILMSTLDVILLYLNGSLTIFHKLNTWKRTLANACLRVDTVDTRVKSVFLYLPRELVCMKVHEHNGEVLRSWLESCQVIKNTSRVSSVLLFKIMYYHINESNEWIAFRSAFDVSFTRRYRS